MIGKVELTNFKCLKSLELEFRAITVLAGRNGSGKSSLVQALRCLKVLESENGHIDFKRLGLGTFHDIYYQFNQTADRQVVLKLDGKSYSLDYAESSADKDRLVARVSSDADGRPTLSALRCLVADRLGPRTIHDVSASGIDERDVGLRGENAVAYLNRHMMDNVDPRMVIRNVKTGSVSSTLANQVSAWMQRFAEDVSVVTEDMNDGGHVRLAFEFGDKTQRAVFSPENVGIGFSRILPALVMLLTAQRGDVLVIENPEMDLHPRGQTELTNLLARVANAGVQVVIETHSDHVVNGLRLAAKRGDLDPGKIKFVFFKRIVDKSSREQFSDVRNLDVNSDGELSDYPKEFLDEWGRTLDRLLDLEDKIRSSESEESSDDSES